MLSRYFAVTAPGCVLNTGPPPAGALPKTPQGTSSLDPCPGCCPDPSALRCCARPSGVRSALYEACTAVHASGGRTAPSPENRVIRGASSSAARPLRGQCTGLHSVPVGAECASAGRTAPPDSAPAPCSPGSAEECPSTWVFFIIFLCRIISMIYLWHGERLPTLDFVPSGDEENLQAQAFLLCKLKNERETIYF